MDSKGKHATRAGRRCRLTRGSYLVGTESTVACSRDDAVGFRRQNHGYSRCSIGPLNEKIERHHISTCDLPETASGWLDLGREAGFSEARQLFVDPSDCLRIFRYDC